MHSSEPYRELFEMSSQRSWSYIRESCATWRQLDELSEFSGKDVLERATEAATLLLAIAGQGILDPSELCK